MTDRRTERDVLLGRMCRALPNEQSGESSRKECGKEINIQTPLRQWA